MSRSPAMPRYASPPRAAVGAWLMGLVVLTACSNPNTAAPASTGAPAPTMSTAASPLTIDPALLAPLTALGPCTAEPNVLDEEPAEGAFFPEGAVLTSQQTTGPLTSIKGYIPMTPVQIRVFYQEQDRYDVVQVEDEIRESEVLLADGNRRLFVKAQAICELGSVFVAVLAPEAAAGQVPAPAGAGG